MRHGHYNLDGKDDKERYLTALGLEQAKITGARLGKIWKDISLLWVKQTKITVARLGKIWKDISLLWVRTDQDDRS